MKIRPIITAMALAGLCFTVPQVLTAQDQSTGQSPSDQGTQAQSSEPGAAHHPMAGAQMRHETPTDINRASKLIGMEVRNQQNERLGTIRDVVVDLPSQRVAYAIMEKQHEQGDTGKYLAVPLSVFSPASDLKHLVLNADKNKIDIAKGFTKGQLPAMPLSSTDLSFWRSISEAAGAAPGSTPPSPQ